MCLFVCYRRLDKNGNVLNMNMSNDVNMNELLHLTSCFLVYESQSQATKCVKARGRAVNGMRCMHRYDYNKVAKKVKNAQIRGESIVNYNRRDNDYQMSRTPNFDSMGMYANDMRISFALNQRKNEIQGNRAPISLTPNFSSYARESKSRGISMNDGIKDGQLLPPKLYYYPPPGMSSLDIYDDPLFEISDIMLDNMNMPVMNDCSIESLSDMQINHITHSAPYGPLTAPNTEVEEKDGVFSITEVSSSKSARKKSENPSKQTVLSVL